LPVGLARVLGISTITALVLCVLALCAATTAWTSALLRRLEGTRHRLGAALWPALVGFALIVYPMHSFGQREHLLLVFTLPYAAAAALRAGGRDVPPGTGTQAAIALYALLGIMLKPYFVTVPVALEL